MAAAAKPFGELTVANKETLSVRLSSFLNQFFIRSSWHSLTLQWIHAPLGKMPEIRI
jgi:hypothetical protein